MKIVKTDIGKMVKNAKNQQKQEAVRGKRKLEEAKKQKNPEEIGEMIGKGNEDAGKIIKTENMIAEFENLHMSAVSNKTIMKIARKDDGKMVKNAKNLQKQEVEQDKRKLEEAKKQKNLEEIREMIVKGNEDAGKMFMTENMIAMFKNLHMSAVSNKTIVKIGKKDNGKMVKNAKNQQK